MLSSGDIIAMEGTLAAGKTTITKGIAQGLDIAEDITSPTFTIVSEYDGRLHLYHIDAYRLENGEDFLNLGAEEMLYADGVCIIEWSENVKEEIPSSAIKIALTPQNDGSRIIKIDNWHYGALE